MTQQEIREAMERYASSYLRMSEGDAAEHFAKLAGWCKEAGPGHEIRNKLGNRKDGTLTIFTGVFDKDGKQVGEWLNDSWLCPPFCRA